MKVPHEAEPAERWAPSPNKQILALCMARRLGLFGDDDGAVTRDMSPEICWIDHGIRRRRKVRISS